MPVFGSIPSLQIASMIVFAVLIFLTKVACMVGESAGIKISVGIAVVPYSAACGVSVA